MGADNQIPEYKVRRWPIQLPWLDNPWLVRLSLSAGKIARAIIVGCFIGSGG